MSFYCLENSREILTNSNSHFLGKGTISSRIIKHFNIKHVSSGDVLRRNIEQKTQLGLEAEKYMNKGQLIPDNKIIDCMLAETSKIKGSWLLDGFPRTEAQAQKLWEIQKIDCVISLDVPYDIIIDRVKKRWVHMGSGRVYNLDFNPPKVQFKDDVTGEPLVQRVDDDPELLKKRLQIYDEMTKPVIDFYKAKNIIHDFRGSTSDEIWPKVKEHLHKYDNL